MLTILNIEMLNSDDPEKRLCGAIVGTLVAPAWVYIALSGVISVPYLVMSIWAGKANLRTLIGNKSLIVNKFKQRVRKL